MYVCALGKEETICMYAVRVCVCVCVWVCIFFTPGKLHTCVPPPPFFFFLFFFGSRCAVEQLMYVP